MKTIEHQIYDLCLNTGIPYLGTHLRAFQGNARRHIYMSYLVQLQSEFRKNGLLNILEIGSWAGGSAITWAEALKTFNRSNGSVLCIDSWTPYFSAQQEAVGQVYREMNSAAGDGSIFQLFQHNIRTANCSNIVFPLVGTSRKLLPLLGREEFDIVFVDGDHSYEAVKTDIEKCKDLVKLGGVICGDDLELQIGEVDQENTVANIASDYIPVPGKGGYHPGVTLAVHETLGKVSCYEGFWLMQKTERGWNPVALPDSRHIEPPAHLNSTPIFVAEFLAQYLKDKGII